MYPWLWFWAPQIHFPWSGSVAQNIEPNTSWFSDMIQPGAGDAGIEQQAFAVASYGTQLGLITNVLLELAGKETLPEQAAAALEDLRRISAKIDAIKADAHNAAAARLEAEIRTLRNRGGTEFADLKRRLAPLLNLDPNAASAS